MPVQLSDHVVEEIRRLTGSGARLDDAARQVGCSISTASKYQAKRSGGGMTPEEIESIVRTVVGQLAPAPQPEPIEHPAKAGQSRSRIFDLSTLPSRPERIAVLSDIHHPFHDRAALRVVFKALRDYEPELIVLNGDYFDCYSISAHSKEPGRADQIQDEFDAARDTTREIEDIAGGVPVIFTEGNHENRLSRIQADNPGLFRLRGMAFPRIAELPEKWTFLPNQGRIKAGPLTILHGDIKGRGTNSMHAAAGMLKKLRTSCLFGHLHRFQEFHETADDGTVRGGFAIGHLCDVSQADYITNPDWQQGFATIDFDWGRSLFSVGNHKIIDRALRWGRMTYAEAE